jgi:hypothetical protein
MMTAEKAADLILGNTPLPAEPVEFYRRDRTGVQTAETTVRSENKDLSGDSGEPPPD